MKSCLIVPPRPYLLSQKALPTLGPLYVAKELKDLGHEVEVLDFADGYKFSDADLYGITCTTPDYYETLKIRDWIKERKPEAKVIVGGPHATLKPEGFSNFDGVCIGDGEIAIKKFLKGEKYAYGFSKDIDSFYPDRSVIDLQQYEFYIDKKKATSMMTARGCIWGECAFCSRIDKGVRFNSVEHVENEVKEIKELGFDAIMIYDDEFFTYPKRDWKISEMLGKYGISWRCFGRTDYTLRNKDLIRYAAKNGLKEMLIGFESGSDRILKIIEKGCTKEQNLEAAKFLNEIGVKVKAAMIVGLPGETEETLKETWEWCDKVEPYVSNWDFTAFTPYPGSKVYENSELYDIKFDKNDIYTAYKGMHSKDWKPARISTSSLSFERIIEWRDKLEKRFKGYK
jgi:radical SAM superfamily enzyme YgiQ (UPF0313 family)